MDLAFKHIMNVQSQFDQTNVDFSYTGEYVKSNADDMIVTFQDLNVINLATVRGR